jgi:hypothetical protein
MATIVERGIYALIYYLMIFLREEYVEMIQKKFWMVLPASKIMHHPELRLSPMGVVPQHERRPQPCRPSLHNQPARPSTPHAHSQQWQQHTSEKFSTNFMVGILITPCLYPLESTHSQPSIRHNRPGKRKGHATSLAVITLLELRSVTHRLFCSRLTDLTIVLIPSPYHSLQSN